MIASNCYVYRLLGLLPDIVLVAGISLGWITRWTYYEYPTLILLGIAGVLIFGVHLVSSLYFDAYWYSCGLMHFWTGWALGVLALLDNAELTHYPSVENVANLMLVASLICFVLVDGFIQLCSKRMNSLVPGGKEWCELVGVGLSCWMAEKHSAALFVLTVAFACSIGAIKLNSFLAVGLLVYLVGLTEVFIFPKLHISVNPIAIMVLFGRLLYCPILQLFSIGKSRLKKWQWFICVCRHWLQKLVLVAVICLQLGFLIIHARSIRFHKEWYVVVPIFGLVGAIWCLMLLVFILVWCILLAKFSRCREIAGDSLIDAAATPSTLVQLKRVLAAKGMRYVGLTAKPLMWGAIAVTFLLHLLCWTVSDTFHASLFVIACVTQLVTLELLWEFSYSLGGTCIGYGILAPTNRSRSDGLVTVLPPDYMEKSGKRIMGTLNQMVHFFAHHLITNFGCDYPQSGLDSLYFEKKLSLFFGQTTYEGPAYDTYLLFYCGPCDTSGDLCLAGESGPELMSFQKILDLWQAAGHSQSRLIIVLDTEYGTKWLSQVRRVSDRGSFVALQTARSLRSYNEGDFLDAFVDWNAGLSAGSGPFEKSLFSILHVRPVYAVSRRFTDLKFRQPSSSDIRRYWFDILPPCTHSCISVLIILLSARTPCTSCCVAFVRVAKRWRMRLYPPTLFDTGHGFRLLSR